MVHVLYSVAAFTCALVTFILQFRVRNNLSSGNSVDRAFQLLMNWTSFFCLMDAAWGIAASELIMNDTLLFILSTVFHISAMLTPVFFLHFVFAYLKNIRLKKVYIIILILAVAAQSVMIVMNAFNKMMFYVDENGIYCSTPIRKVLFYLQYAAYVGTALIAIFSYFRETIAGKKESANYKAVLLFVAAPIICGIFQMIYPDAPAYSIGYMLSVCIIYTFILTDMLEKRMLEQVRAEAASEAKTSFLFNMSHDIRTPMNAILGYTDIGLRHVGDTEMTRDSFEKIKSSGNHLLNLINDILEMSRIEAGKLELTEDPLDIREAIAGVEDMSRALAVPKSIDFAAVIGNIPNPYIYADELHVNEVLINLISNAVKYTETGGKVRYHASQIGGVVDGKAVYRFMISDNGIGMSEEFQEHLFEAFSREATATVSRQEGAGLGLSIVKRIVDMTGGSISVHSVAGEGSTFTVEMPFRVMDEQAIAEFKKTEEGIGGVEEDVVLEGKRVLLVEDNEMNREIATDILDEAGLVVETAEDGTFAVRAIREKGAAYYDFILMDIQMPVMNGYEATKAIRQIPDCEKIPIIALSANAFKEDIDKSLAVGMNAHIAKPIDVHTLFETLHGLIH